MAKSSIPFNCIKRHTKAWWSAEMEEAVRKRRKTFATAHRSDRDRQAYISASRRASSVIANAKAEAWQATYSSLSSKSNPRSVYSLLFGSVPYSFGKDGSGVLAICSLYGIETTLSYSAGPVCSSFLLKHAPFCMLFLVSAAPTSRLFLFSSPLI